MSQEMPTTRQRRATRRQVLQTSGVAAAGAAFLATNLAVDAAPAASGFRAAPRRVSNDSISFLMRSDAKSAYAADTAAEAWGKVYGAKVTIDVPPAGVDPSQKIQAAQAAGDLIWDGMSYMTAPWSTLEYITRDIIQPLDAYLAASTIPDAKAVIDGIIPTIRESLKYEGKQYSIPANVGSIALAWMTAPLAKAGVTADPVSWDEVHAAAAKVVASDPSLTPFDSAQSPMCDLLSMMWGGGDAPVNAAGLFDITGESAIAAINWLKMMVSENLMPATRSAATASVNQNFQDWQKGATAIFTSFDVAATINQQTFGIAAAKNGINIRREKDKVRAGTPFFTNGCVVLNKAKNPQGMTDFLLWMFGPSNDATGKQIATVAAKPCYQYTYDKFVTGKPDYQWEADAIEIIKTSVPFPTNLYYTLQGPAIQPWLEKALSGNTDPAEAMAGAAKDIADQVAKLKTA